jgi:hypothetical protein
MGPAMTRPRSHSRSRLDLHRTQLARLLPGRGLRWQAPQKPRPGRQTPPRQVVGLLRRVQNRLQSSLPAQGTSTAAALVAAKTLEGPSAVRWSCSDLRMNVQARISEVPISGRVGYHPSAL